MCGAPKLFLESDECAAKIENSGGGTSLKIPATRIFNSGVAFIGRDVLF
jgi:hypothetical protein